jgi:hypothetical protein
MQEQYRADIPAQGLGLTARWPGSRCRLKGRLGLCAWSSHNLSGLAIDRGAARAQPVVTMWWPRVRWRGGAANAGGKEAQTR